MGRNKIPIKKIEKRQSLYQTFCKRRQGIKSKAVKLKELFNLDTIFIAFSPAGKPFVESTIAATDLDASIDSILNRFFNSHDSPAVDPTSSSSSSSNLLQISSENQIETDDHSCSRLSVQEQEWIRNATQSLMKVDIASLSLSQLQSYKLELEQLKLEVLRRRENMVLSSQVVTDIPIIKADSSTPEDDQMLSSDEKHHHHHPFDTIDVLRRRENMVLLSSQDLPLINADRFTTDDDQMLSSYEDRHHHHHHQFDTIDGDQAYNDKETYHITDDEDEISRLLGTYEMPTINIDDLF